MTTRTQGRANELTINGAGEVKFLVTDREARRLAQASKRESARLTAMYEARAAAEGLTVEECLDPFRTL